MSNAQARHCIKLRALLQTAYMTSDHLTSQSQSSANINYTSLVLFITGLKLKQMKEIKLGNTIILYLFTIIYEYGVTETYKEVLLWRKLGRRDGFCDDFFIIRRQESVPDGVGVGGGPEGGRYRWKAEGVEWGSEGKNGVKAIFRQHLQILDCHVLRILWKFKKAKMMKKNWKNG